MAKPGFTIRPNKKASQVITELSKKMGVSKNKLVTSFIEEALPHMEQMLSALELLEDNNPEGFKRLSETLTSVIIESSEKQTDIVDLMACQKSEK